MHVLRSLLSSTKTRFTAVLCLASLLSTQALGADDGTDPSVTVLKDVYRYVVQKDGSFVQTMERVLQVNEQRAISAEAQREFHFNRTHEDVDILEAYTEKPDGRRIPVLPEQIKLQQEPAYSGAPMFQDMQVKTLIYSDVAVGDKLVSKTRLTRHIAVFPGQFSDAAYPLFRPTRQLTLIYDLPSGMPLHVDNIGFKASPPAQHEGRTLYRWDEIPADNPRLEHGAVNYSDFGRRLIVSTFDSYASVGLAFDRSAARAAAPSTRVEATARELVRGLSDPRDKAFAIDNWVRENVRYVAVYVGNGGIEPHSAESVLDNRYGDCKDHATLMEAMLRAVGIDSTPVLINAGDSYKLSPVASLGLLNHAITYIPSLDLYLDSTAKDVAPGYLPIWDLDKDVILTRTGRLAHTPVRQPSKIKSRFTMQLAADGSASFQFTRGQEGLLEEVVRYEQSNLPKADVEHAVENVLTSFGVKGSGNMELDDLSGKGRGKGYSYTMRGNAENWVYLPGTIGVVANSSLYIGLAQKVFELTNEGTRTQPFVCPENDYEEEAAYELPKNASLLAVPPDVHIASPYLEYHAEFKRMDGKLLIARRFRSGKAGTRVCTPADYQAMQADIRKIVRDLRSQFVLQVPDLVDTAVVAK